MKLKLLNARWPFLINCLVAAEDEQQQKTLSCSKSVRQLTLERDQAMADLNSVERSFADLFRRYENMKGVLEGFKKVGGAINPIMQCGVRLQVISC